MSIVERKESLAGATLKLLESGEHADVTFLVGREKDVVKAHKLILLARSQFFKEKFAESQENGQGRDADRVVEVPESTASQFRLFLKFVYADKFDKKMEMPEIMGLLALGHKFRVQSLLWKCDDVLASRFVLDQSVMDIYRVARNFSRVAVMSKMENTIASKFDDFLRTEEFLLIDTQLLRKLLGREDLDIDEVDLFEAVLRWGEAQVRNNARGQRSLRSVLEPVLSLVRFPTMTPQQFATVVRPTKVLSDADMVDIYTYLVSPDHQRDELARALKFKTGPRAGACHRGHNDEDDVPGSSGIAPEGAAGPRREHDISAGYGRRRRRCVYDASYMDTSD